MLSVWAGLIAASTMGTSAATATTATAAQDTFLVIGVQSRGDDRFVTLRCDPASGTHPHSESACRVLREAGGDSDWLRTCQVAHRVGSPLRNASAVDGD